MVEKPEADKPLEKAINKFQRTNIFLGKPSTIKTGGRDPTHILKLSNH